MSIVATLSAQVRGVAALCNHIVELFCYKYLTRNPFVVESLADKLTAIQAVSRVRIATNTDYHGLIKQVVALLSAAQPFEGRFRTPQDGYKYECILPVVRQYDAAIINAPTLHPSIASAVTQEMGGMLQVLLCAVRHGNKVGVQTMLEYLSLSNELAPVMPVIHDSITCVREALRADIVFALWILILEHSPQGYHEWVKHHIALYVVGYRRLHRESRLPLLFFCYGTITKRRSVRHEPIVLPILIYPATAPVKTITTPKKAVSAPLAAATARKLEFLMAASVPEL
jgi:hypothetical protein